MIRVSKLAPRGQCRESISCRGCNDARGSLLRIGDAIVIGALHLKRLASSRRPTSSVGGSVRPIGRGAEVFPSMTLTIAIVLVESGDDRHHAQLLDALTVAKREANQRKRDRRVQHFPRLATG